jgi:A/G-specific adenine glycosylase
MSAVNLDGTLLRWYRRRRRDLPWRRTRDPYAIWIAETMLQQTRSETVLRYYPRFLARFPTLSSLARARESAVLAAWSGLGYYARAHNLRWAARRIVERHDGRMPRGVEALRALPGIGRYTAGAVASIAFGVRTPVLDGNVARVLARWFAVCGPVRSHSVMRSLWRKAERLVHRSAPGDWNQALMELGATVCTPRAPACGRCPVRRGCAAHRAGRVDHFPEVARRPAMHRVRRVCVVLEAGDRVLMVQRDRERLLRGLWEFPGVDLVPDEAPQASARVILKRLGAKRPRLRPAGSFLHTITNRRIQTFVFGVSIARGEPRTIPQARWLRRDALARLPLSAAGLRIAARLAQSRRDSRPRR